jgi:DNA-binding transcriptional LysR family regulator
VVARARRITHEARELLHSAELLQQGDGGSIRVGLGSGPGAMLMTPFLCHMAAHHPAVQVSISRGPTELQLVQLRSRQLEALVVDMRRVVPAPDLLIEPLVELKAGFVCRADHPLASKRSVTLADVLAYPVASTPLSDEVARLLVANYGPQANPSQMTTLQCEEVSSLINTVEQTQAVLLGVVAAAREGLQAGRLVQLPMSPPLLAGARFAYVTLAGRTQAPVMRLFQRFVNDTLRD